MRFVLADFVTDKVFVVLTVATLIMHFITTYVWSRLHLDPIPLMNTGALWFFNLLMAAVAYQRFRYWSYLLITITLFHIGLLYAIMGAL